MSSTTAAMYFLEDMGSFFCRQASQQGVRIGLLVEATCLYREAGGSRFESGGFPPVIWEMPFFYPFSDRVLQSTLVVMGWTTKRDSASGRYCIMICLVLQSSRSLASFERQSALAFSSLGI
ncbi:UNVERIFIED_CONTAM: hypothetical protein Slati_4453800 [Sesamum latifolium]|uniref:Uncharacterized protein n=1 Tax=Sesamum latifolium TaxID=2727402 RepID=A0AAW2STA3_9LAMI